MSSTYFKVETQKHESVVARVKRLRSIPTTDETLLMLKQRKEARAIVNQTFAEYESQLRARKSAQPEKTILQKLRLKK